ncbi:MAG: hypothetical protein AB7L71_06455 [Vicinamibacterales bacterium]
MKVEAVDPPRRFAVGAGAIPIHHSANVSLDADEQVTFVAESGSQYDVVRKSWGYYATPSLNARLPEHGLHPVLVRNTVTGRAFILLVERGAEISFDDYCASESLEVIARLDTDGAITDLCRAIEAHRR